MFVAIARIPADPFAIAKAADITGIALPDATRLLAGTLPRVLLRSVEGAEQIVGSLERAGFIAFSGEEAAILSDRDRVVARNLEWLPTGIVALDAQGRRHECRATSILALIKGLRWVDTSEVTTSTERRLSLGKALITGGLAITKKVESSVEKTHSTKESLLLIHRNDGLPGILLTERRLNYQCLGTDLQPSTLGNFMLLATRIRGLAPQVTLDDRITRPGFLKGLPPMSVAPEDLALYLVSNALARGC